MGKIRDNIKETFAELFGFKEVKEVKEWNECLAGLEKNGFFSSEDIKTFKESEKTTDDFIKRLEVQNGAEKKRKTRKENIKENDQQDVKTEIKDEEELER